MLFIQKEIKNSCMHIKITNNHELVFYDEVTKLRDKITEPSFL